MANLVKNPDQKQAQPPTITNTTTNTFSGFPRLKFLRARDAAVGNDFQGNAPRLQATAQIDHPLGGGWYSALTVDHSRGDLTALQHLDTLRQSSRPRFCSTPFQILLTQ